MSDLPAPETDASQLDAAGADVATRKFQDLPLCDELKRAMSEGFAYENLTEVQAKTFDHIIAGQDLVARAKTGAGKTLSFLVPAMERAQSRKGTKTMTGSIDILVVSPVRELSMQIAQEAEKLAQYCSGVQVVCMTGGVPWTEDLEALDTAGTDVVILVVTPGRLQTHLNKTPGFPDRIAQLQIFVLDEVDQLAHEIFNAASREIIQALPPATQRQSLFYSATMSDAVHALVKEGAKDNYTFVDILQSAEQSTPSQIDQFYNVVPTEDMTRALWGTIQAAKSENATPKIVVIFMTGRIASYYAEAFRLSGSELAVFEIHARLKQNKRTAESDKFRAAESGILFTSDVSSRGLDYPGVTEVIQMGAPHSKDEYIHRLGRTGRAGNQGRGFLLMHEFERSFLTKELHDQPVVEAPLDLTTVGTMPDFISMKIAANTKAQAYYSRINHVMRNNSEEMSVLEIMREAQRFAASVGALDNEGRPPEITQDNAAKMGVADIDDPCVYIVAGAASAES